MMNENSPICASDIPACSDVRTPLPVIAGAASTLARHGATLEPAARKSLALSIEDQAQEMSNLISNVLDLMRLESGRVELRRDTHSVEDLVGTALHRLQQRLQHHPVAIDLPDDLPAVSGDPVLVSQVLATLLDKYADQGVAEIETKEALKVAPFTELGRPRELANKGFGGPQEFEQAITELEAEIYRQPA